MSKYKFSEELSKLQNEYLEYNRVILKKSNSTIWALTASINYLYLFMQDKGISKITNLTQKDIIKFQYFLYRFKHSVPRTIILHIYRLNSFCRYLYHKNLIWKNPFEKIKYISPPEDEDLRIKRRYTFEELITRWNNFMKRRENHIVDVKHRLNSLRFFIAFLETKNIKTAYKVKPETIDEFKRYLYNYQYSPDCHYSPFIQLEMFRSVCMFFLYLYRERLIKYEPSQHIILNQYYREVQSQYLKERGIPKRGIKKPRIANHEVQNLAEKFIQYHIASGGSKLTVNGYRIAIEKFYSYISSRNITDLHKVTRRDIMDYQSWLSTQICSSGFKYAQNTLQNLTVNLRSFFRYLIKYEYLTCDPSSGIDIPKSENTIPHNCMTEREVCILLNAPDTSDSVGLRDKAIMELLYSTGIRANELVNISVSDIDFSQGLLMVEHPKGGKSFQRVIPVGKTACNYVKLYLTKVRPTFNHSNNKGYLFLSSNGKKLYKTSLNTMIHKYLYITGLRKKISTHSFRVSCATHMLLHKADIRYVQQQLGHISIRTTQEYTRLIPKDLKAVHSRCHPREKKHLDKSI